MCKKIPCTKVLTFEQWLVCDYNATLDGWIPSEQMSEIIMVFNVFVHGTYCRLLLYALIYCICQNIQGGKLWCLSHPQKVFQVFYITSLNLYLKAKVHEKFSSKQWTLLATTKVFPSKVLPYTVYHMLVALACKFSIHITSDAFWLMAKDFIIISVCSIYWDL